MKYLIYARVSPRGSDFDGETSIKMQIDICKDYVKGQGPIVKLCELFNFSVKVT